MIIVILTLKLVDSSCFMKTNLGCTCANDFFLVISLFYAFFQFLSQQSIFLHIKMDDALIGDSKCINRDTNLGCTQVDVYSNNNN